MALSAQQRPEPRKDSNLKRKGLTVSPRGGPVFSTARVLAPQVGFEHTIPRVNRFGLGSAGIEQKRFRRPTGFAGLRLSGPLVW